MLIWDHYFTSYGAEEMLCRRCGYVIWPCKTEEAVKSAIRQIECIDDNHELWCGGKHHVQIVKEV